MTWHAETLRLEVAVEFQRVTPHPWRHLEEALWRSRLIAFANWGQHGLWWRKTTAGKAYDAGFKRRQAAKLKSQTVGNRRCAGCQKSFSVNAYRAKRGRDKVCSAACRGRARTNIRRYRIGDEELTLTEWSARSGVATGTICRRLALGWDLYRAVFAPLRGTP